MKSIGDNVIRIAGVFNPKDLESLDLKVYEEFKPVAIVRDLVTIKDDDPPWAEVISYDKIERVGVHGAGLGVEPGPSGVPLINAKLTRVSQAVKTISYGVFIRKSERRAAEGLGRNIETILANYVAYYLARDENTLFFYGDDDLNVQGLFDVGTPVSGLTGDWDNASGSQILEDLRKAQAVLSAIDDLRNDRIALVLSSAQKENLNKSVSTTIHQPVMQIIKENGWFPAGIFFSQTINANQGLVLSTAPEHVQLSVVQDVEREEPVRNAAGDVEIVWSLRTAGAIVRYPEAVAVLNGL